MLEQPCTAITIESKDIETRMKIEIRDIGIPPRPSILGQIEKETLKDAPDFVSLAKLIGSDVGLAAGLIKTANSPFFGFGKKVRTVQEALLVLGLKLVVQTIAGLSLRQMFNHLPQMERFWDTSANTARVAGWLAKQLKKDSVNETCNQCHMEKRGPFVHNHQPVVEDCGNCHNPHGTTTQGMVKMRPPFLCQQCHEPTSHRGNFPGINGVIANSSGSGGLTQARGCANCHTNTHGGNNATDAVNSRNFRR